ncbi:MAG: MutS-related protein [Chitinophagales bacterium]
MDVLKQYYSLKDKHQLSFDELNKRFHSVSLLRFVLVLAILICLYFLVFKTFTYLLFTLFIVLVLGFLLVLSYHSKIVFKRKFTKELIKINQEEIDFLEKGEVPFKNGIEYLKPKHIYAFDLDIFGHKSLFQHLNRTATYIGEKTLAGLLTKKAANEDILNNQNAIKELNEKLSWKQNLFAFAKLSKDEKNKYELLHSWLKSNNVALPKWVIIASYVLPFLFIGFGLAYFISKENVFFNLFYQTFLLNVLVAFSQIKKMTKELSFTTKIEEITKAYSLIFEEIENENFESVKLIALKAKLNLNNQKASSAIKELANIFSKLASVQNVFGSILLNGFFQYHIHIYRKLQTWKKENNTSVNNWLKVLGEFEALNSLSNFSYNNPEYAFPEINTDKNLTFNNLGHPLLSKKERVDNDISFKDNRFVILTGSNMSGKSTFLRSLGVNMVLACCSSVVCASSAKVQPMQLLVSMRLMDSLEENESYFFAEVKKLKLIMDLLEKDTSFVLLDEILRGTNSDDKRQGTIEVIKQMISKKAIGIIATHDLEVCNTTDEFPEILSNKCFEVEIVDNDLHFDFKLRKGVCKNKSASFLMKKMKVI